MSSKAGAQGGARFGTKRRRVAGRLGNGRPGSGYCAALAHIKMPGWNLQGDERRKARNKRRRIRQGRAA